MKVTPEELHTWDPRAAGGLLFIRDISDEEAETDAGKLRLLAATFDFMQFAPREYVDDLVTSWLRSDEDRSVQEDLLDWADFFTSIEHLHLREGEEE